jgi:hypothetical protein
MLHQQFPLPTGLGLLEEKKESKPELMISTRPEIRKGCVWEVQLRFSADVIKKHGLKQIYIEKPKNSGAKEVAYLCLKVRSKLITPRRELAFRKVAEIENETEFLELNEFGVITLKVRFTQRPRAVFHKHADVMILMVNLKNSRTDQSITYDEHELIFRGGTGSQHSADNRKRQYLEVHQPDGASNEQQQQQQYNMQQGSAQSNSYMDPPSSGLDSEVLNATELVTDFLTGQSGVNLMHMQGHPFHSVNSLIASPTLGGMSLTSGLDDLTPPSLASMDTLCNSFLSNTPSSIASLTNGSASSSSFLSSNNTNITTSSAAFLSSNMSAQMSDSSAFGLDASDLLNASRSFFSSGTLLDCPSDTFAQLPSTAPSMFSSSHSTTSSSSSASLSASTLPTPAQPTTPSKFTVVFDKRRGGCTRCKAECEVYQGTGGSCNNCGCFPAMHLDVDKPAHEQMCKKRKHEAVEEDDETSESETDQAVPPLKRRKYILETEFYQKLFFKSIAFMTLDELASLCNNAPIPLFVKDENSVYKYVNTSFCNFILDTVRKDNIVNKRTNQVLSGHEADEVVKMDKYLMTREGKIMTFNVAVNRQEYRVIKLYTRLRDGMKVVVGAVVSSL